ncbi:hypothetical protein KSP39_PZI016082 [Platanthera zijinensis]|uniref:Retrotransposon gag domain-containing protein n=1 Tax=Platanthera zijinensis TaxID=2320716 RepID=A0AAP0B6C1_9ASPA
MKIFLRASPPKFSGSTDPLVAEGWLLQVERVFEGIECLEEKRAALIEFILEKDAEAWLDNYKRIELHVRKMTNISWQEFVGGFQNWYLPISARQKMKEHFVQLTQGNLSVTEYEAKFASILRHAPDVVRSVEQQIFLLRCGLCESIQTILSPLNFHDYHTLVEAARQVEQSQKSLHHQQMSNKRKKQEFDHKDRGSVEVMITIRIMTFQAARSAIKSIEASSGRIGRKAHAIFATNPGIEW